MLPKDGRYMSIAKGVTTQSIPIKTMIHAGLRRREVMVACNFLSSGSWNVPVSGDVSTPQSPALLDSLQMEVRLFPDGLRFWDSAFRVSRSCQLFQIMNMYLRKK